MPAAVSVAFGPSSNSTCSARRPCIAAHVFLATTATPCGICTTCVTPATALAFVASNARDLAAKDRTARDDRVEHARQLHVDAEDGFARDLGGRVDALNRLADQLELRRILERDDRRHRQLRGRLGEAAVGQTRVRRGVDHGAVVRAALSLVDAPTRGRSLHEHVARRGASAAHRFVRRADGHAAERALQRAAVERRVDRRKLCLDAATSRSRAPRRATARATSRCPDRCPACE